MSIFWKKEEKNGQNAGEERRQDPCGRSESEVDATVRYGAETEPVGEIPGRDHREKDSAQHSGSAEGGVRQDTASTSDESKEGEAPGVSEEESPGEKEALETAENAEDCKDPLCGIGDRLDKRILKAIQNMGFEKLSPIQEQAIPDLLDGRDIIGQAQTGTGKTAAFGIPAIQKVDPELNKLQVIILCPTRELAIQAAEELRRLAKYMQGIKVLPVYGGQEIGRQIAGLRGVQIIVGTPGRVMDHMRRHTIKLDDIRMVVLDEADEMLNMGFREDMETILGQIPGDHQTALFSATMPKPILEITNQFQKDAKLIKVAAKELTIPLVSQRYYRIKRQDKDAACVRILEYYQPKLTLIFCNTKHKVDEVAEMLKRHGYQAEGLHGDMSQNQRDVAMGRFRNGSTTILIATDVAARGIDVDDVEAVINYDIPQDIEYYVHRIGRTGRAGRRGRSFTFVCGREMYQLREIERVCHTTVEEKKLPGAAKVLKAKADKYLNRAWELHEHEDMELMKRLLERKLEAEECDIMDLAAAMLKLQVGDKGQEIEADDSGRRFGDRRGRGEDRGGRRREGRGGWGSRRRDEEREGRGGRRRDEEREGRGGRRRDEEREGRGGRRRDGDREGRAGRRPDGDREGRAGRRLDGDREGRAGRRLDGDRESRAGRRLDGDRESRRRDNGERSRSRGYFLQ